MKNKLFIGVFLILSFFTCLNAFSKVITVNNRLDVNVADYISIKLAVDNATDGDTILVYPSEIYYEGLNITKKVILIGSGFTSTSNLPATKITGAMNFFAGSSGSVIESFGGDFELNVTDANNISICRNVIRRLGIQNSFNSLLMGNLVNTTFINGNSLVEAYNCVFKVFGFYPGINLDATSSINISNSIIYGGNISISGGIVKGKNNLLYNDVIAVLYESYNSLVYSRENGTNFNANFIDFDNSNYHLKPGSPAIGTGENGTDMGIYGGNTPYVDGGYPSIPVIYYLDVPLTGSQKDGINITVKAKTNQ